MELLQNLVVNFVEDCCAETLKLMSGNFGKICEDTRNWYACWRKERQYRITGSICYSLFTYSHNKNANWVKKCQDTFFIKNFKSDYTEYGKNTEAEARKAFVESTKINVVEVGLVVSKQNPWLTYSPDGVIFDHFKPAALLGIKCPFIGKTENIEATVNNQVNKCLFKSNEQIILLEKKHRYYGQIQLGMAVLNVPFTYFVLYSSFEKQVFTLKVDRDDAFLCSMLTTLKQTYFNHMLHYICMNKENIDSKKKVMDGSVAA